MAFINGAATLASGEAMLYFLIAAAAVAGLAAWTDSRTGHIPNWLTLGALGAGVSSHLVTGWLFDGGWHGALLGLGLSVGGAVLCLVIPAFMYWRGAMGGGDVKLFAAIGALCLPMIGLEVEIYSFAAAALIAPAKLAYHGVLFRTLGASFGLLLNPFRKKTERHEAPPELKTWFRLGPAIFLAAATTVFLHWVPS